MIQIDICGSAAAIRSQQILTCGTVGATVHFRFDEPWQSLAKTAVFRCGDITRDVVNVTDTAVIPHQVLTLPGLPLQIGVYGASRDGKVAIPTVWATTYPVQPGADPSGDPGLEPSNPAWQQALNRIGDIDTALDEIIALQEEILGGEG